MTQWGLDALFNPAKRHMDDEKLRLQSTREEVGDASGGKRIDLDSGKVRIPRRALATSADEAELDEAGSDGAEAAETESSEAESSEAESSEAESSEAESSEAASSKADSDDRTGSEA